MPDLCDQAKHRGISLFKGIISPVILSSGQSGDKRGDRTRVVLLVPSDPLAAATS